MIAVDTSALVAVLNKEGDAEAFKHFFGLYAGFVMSAATYLEAAMVVQSRLDDGRERLDEMIAAVGIDIRAFDRDQARLAADAHRRYGRGSGSPAKLNFGDCFSYALARSLGLPLLFKGDDFVHTDIAPALAP